MYSTANGLRLLGRYTLLEKLGAGGQGEVWRARDEARDADVALKVLPAALARDEAAWRALCREHDIAARLEHPHILRIHAPQRDADAAVLPMELVAGGDLTRLRGASYLHVVPALIEIAQALEYAHERGIVHRDLKPSNVLLDSRGHVRLADFGVAGSSSAAGGVAGLSPFSASPAQLRGEPPTPADDVYGLGAVAYELLSGYPPFYPHFDAARALEEPVPPLRAAQAMPPGLERLVLRMLAKRPQSRPHDMREIIDELDAALHDTLAYDFGAPSGVAEPVVAPSRRSPASPPSVAARPLPAAAAAAPGQSRASAASAAAPLRRPAAPAAPATPVAPVAAATAAAARASAPAAAAAPAVAASAPAGASAHGSASAPATASTPGSVSARGPAAAPAPTMSARAAAPAVAADSPAITAEPLDRPLHVRPLPDRPPPPPERVLPSAPWPDVHVERRPSLMRLEQVPSRRWPWVLLAALILAAIGVFWFLPEYVAQTQPASPGMDAGADTDAGRAAPDSTADPKTGATGAGAASDPTATADGRRGASTAMGAAAAPGAAARPGATARPGPAAGTPFAGTSNKPTADAGLARARAAREALDRRLATLESRGAGVWGGRDFATARQRAAEAVGALDAGSARIAEERLAEGARLLGSVEGRAGVALANQLAAGQRALDAGQSAAALQAFESARRIDPGSRRASEGLRRARSLDRVLPLLAEGENAESQQDHGRAVQAYSQALTIDPSDAKAKAGLERARAALGSDNYAKALGQGYAALGQDHIEEARAAFDRARSLRLDGPEAAAGLARVGAALRARGFEGARARAADLEAQERWSDALQEYEGALAIDPSLQFAQAGKARAAARNELGSKLQGLLDRPERLAAPSVRAEALALLDRARSASPSGPVIRSQIARLEILLPEFDKPVRVALESDNATRVTIQRVGEFGPFARRELELKPGKYTIVGTRAGYRDVRHDVTVAPGQEVQTISVRCLEPI